MGCDRILLSGSCLRLCALACILTEMATLRHGSPVEIAGYFDKQGKNNRFPRYLRLVDVVLSNSHHESLAPSWQVSVLHCTMTRGTLPREFHVTLPKRVVSYFARSDEQYNAWLVALDTARSRVVERYYDVGNVLGMGAFSTVHSCTDLLTRDVFAVKAIDKSKACARVDLSLREVDIMVRLCHPNIVETHDIFENITHLYLVIEYMQGGELFDIIADSGHLTEQRASQVIRDVISAVRYLHNNGVVHCDIKPENILCKTKAWPLSIKLCDFGLAGIVEAGQTSHCNLIGNPGHLTAKVGTPNYCSPELVRGQPYGTAVDMWACGVLLYIMLSGKMPFYGRDDQACLKMVATGRYQFPEREWRTISNEAKSLVRGLLQVDPDKRLTADAALQHVWLKDPNALSAAPIQNDLSGIHSSRRKFRRAVMAAVTVQRMNALGEAAGALANR